MKLIFESTISSYRVILARGGRGIFIDWVWYVDMRHHRWMPIEIFTMSIRRM